MWEGVLVVGFKEGNGAVKGEGELGYGLERGDVGEVVAEEEKCHCGVDGGF